MVSGSKRTVSRRHAVVVQDVCSLFLTSLLSLLASLPYVSVSFAYLPVSNSKPPKQPYVVIFPVTDRYSTGSTPDVFSALIQNFFSGETAPFPAVHLTVDVTAEGNEDGLGVQGWVSYVARCFSRGLHCQHQS